jgi:hypothetical protein
MDGQQGAQTMSNRSDKIGAIRCCTAFVKKTAVDSKNRTDLKQLK